MLKSEDNKQKLFLEAKMNQDPLLNAIGVNDIEKLAKIKENQMHLSQFNKE